MYTNNRFLSDDLFDSLTLLRKETISKRKNIILFRSIYTQWFTWNSANSTRHQKQLHLTIENCIEINKRQPHPNVLPHLYSNSKFPRRNKLIDKLNSKWSICHANFYVKLLTKCTISTWQLEMALKLSLLKMKKKKEICENEIESKKSFNTKSSHQYAQCDLKAHKDWNRSYSPCHWL